MAQRDFILELDGIKGESQVKKGLIDILSWNWAVENQGSLGEGTGGGGTGKAQIHDLTFTKVIDQASPNLFLYCCNGTHIDKATLTCKKSAGNKPLDFLVIEMKTCMVTGVATGGSDGGGQISETFTLNFEEFKVSYTPQDKKGTAKGSVDIGFNIAENKTA
jgi:type VI secretion system secreted protein Hcp